MPPAFYQASSFDQGMTPKVFEHNAVARIEHFDTITDVLRPFRTLVASNVDSTTPAVAKLINFELYNGDIYGVGIDYTDATKGALYKWTTAFSWQYMYSFGIASVPSPMLQAHSTYLFGLRNGTHLYRYDPAGNTYSLTFYPIAYSYFCDAITHSKDGKMYFATDNKIHSVDSTGTAGILALTLPNTNFRITSLCEQGNYLNIVGYDVNSGESASLLWDRDTSLVDLTESYALGRDTVVHNTCLLGQTYTVQIRKDTSNSAFQEKPVLVIKYLRGTQFETLVEFPVTSLSVPNNMIGAKYQSLDRFYFTANVQFDNETSARNVCFCLDSKGRLTIAQNLGIDTGTLAITGVLRDGEGFWFGAGSDGAWNTTTTYTTISAFESTNIRAGRYYRGRYMTSFDQNLAFQAGTVTCEPLPAGAQILVRLQKNEETAWTTVATLTGTNKIKFSLTNMKVINSLLGLDKARLIRARLESTGGAAITGFQLMFKEVADDTI